MIYLEDTWKSILTIDGSANTLTYDVLNLMGGKSNVKSVKKVTVIQINNQKTYDSTKKTKLEKEGSQVLVEFKKEEVIDFSWTSHLLVFEFEGAGGSTIYINKTFEVKTTIVEELGASVAQSNSKSAPDRYQVDNGYPIEFSAFNTNENPYLHIQIQAQFYGDAEMQDHPAAVYITLIKDADQLPYTVHADYIPSIKRYQIFADLKLLMKE